MVIKYKFDGTSFALNKDYVPDTKKREMLMFILYLRWSWLADTKREKKRDNETIKGTISSCQ